MQSVTPKCTHFGLGSSAFARRYLRNRCFFLFLRLLRCFSSAGSLSYVMNWRMNDWRLSSRVSPFRDLRIKGYLLLPEAFRSLSRLSSALSAKASTLCSFKLDQMLLFRGNGRSTKAASVLLLVLCFFLYSVAYLSICLGCLVFLNIFKITRFSICDFQGTCRNFGLFVQLNSFTLVKVHERPRTKFIHRLRSNSLSCFRPLEMERFELVTPCLQGRCSPN